MRIGILAACLCLLYGCCTKKKCSDRIEPFINVNMVGFPPAELELTKLICIDKETDSILFSREFTVIDNVIPITSMTESKEMRDQKFVIKIQTTSDTITDVSYELFAEHSTCNNCFLGKDRITITNFRNFSFVHKNQRRFSDNMTITK